MLFSDGIVKISVGGIKLLGLWDFVEDGHLCMLSLGCCWWEKTLLLEVVVVVSCYFCHI